ncbi:ABC transporter permease [Candidatus Bathyarchaeota archaeon]|nr:ABC transporter permease [Candidatus Bathyarchaeota archaeon]
MDHGKIVELMSAETPRKKLPTYQVVISFIVRDFLIWWTYKFWLTLDITGNLLFVATYYLFSLITSPQQIQEAGYVTGGYFTFALIGIAFQQYVFFAVQSINQSVREEQVNGTMETVLSSATDFKVFLLGETCFFFIICSAFLFISFFAGYLLGATFTLSIESLLSVIVLSALLIASHMAIGVLSAGVIMKTKQGNPLTWVFSWLTQLVSGVFYPLKLLPWYVEWIGKLFPLTYSLDGIRLCLQGGQSLASSAVMNNVVNLLIFTVAATPIAVYVFKLGYDAARRDGSLGQY